MRGAPCGDQGSADTDHRQAQRHRRIDQRARRLDSENERREEAGHRACGYDAEDGMLADSSLTWTSSRDGMLGRGRRVIASKLSSGRHILTLTGTDSHGKKGTHRVTVTVGGREKSSR